MIKSRDWIGIGDWKCEVMDGLVGMWSGLLGTETGRWGANWIGVLVGAGLLWGVLGVCVASPGGVLGAHVQCAHHWLKLWGGVCDLRRLYKFQFCILKSLREE